MRRAGQKVAVALAVLVASGTGAAAARAQQRPIIHGVVRTMDEPVPFAVVALAPGFGQRFSDDSGAFTFSSVPPGTYHLTIRQIGFRPFDTTVVKTMDRPLDLVLRLERLSVQLSEITVTAERRCTTPGIPDSAASPALTALFDQLRQNAERYAFLADSYPFRYRLARTYADLDQSGQVVWSARDTVEYQSNANVHYKPGDIVGWGLGPTRSRARVLKLPTLSDLADSTFQANHCFTYVGTVRGDSGTLVRFQFGPAEFLQLPDIQGEVYLDAASYQIRRASFELTHAPRAMPGLLGARDVVTYAELYPNIVVPQLVEGSLEPAPRFGVMRPVVKSTETQRLLGVRFMRPLPGRSPPGR